MLSFVSIVCCTYMYNGSKKVVVVKSVRIALVQHSHELICGERINSDSVPHLGLPSRVVCLTNQYLHAMISL